MDTNWFLNYPGAILSESVGGNVIVGSGKEDFGA